MIAWAGLTLRTLHMFTSSSSSLLYVCNFRVSLVAPKNGIELTIIDAGVRCAPHDVQAGEEPKALSVELVRCLDIYAALGGVQLVVDLFVDPTALGVADGQAPVGQAGLPWELLPHVPHAAHEGLAHHVGVELKEAAAVAAPVSGEVDSVAVAQTLEERRVFDDTAHAALAPPVECGAKMTPEDTQADEARAGELPL